MMSHNCRRNKEEGRVVLDGSQKSRHPAEQCLAREDEGGRYFDKTSLHSMGLEMWCKHLDLAFTSSIDRLDDVRQRLKQRQVA